MRKKLIAIILALVCAAVMCLPVQAAKPTGTGNYLSGSVSSDSDTDDTVAQLMDGFEYVFSGVYNEDEGYEILLAFDTTNFYGFVGITQPEESALIWALLGVWTSNDDGSESFSNDDQDYAFNFVIEEETEDGMVISLPDDGDGQLTLETADLSDLEDFFTTMVSGGFSEDGSSNDSSSSSGDSEVDDTVAQLMDGFEYVFSGVYNEDEGYEILLAFDTENSYGFVGITQPSSNTLVWALLGEWSSEDDVETFSSEDYDYPFNFVIEEETEDGMTISMPDDGNGQLTLETADLSDLEEFFTKMVSGEFAEE